MSRPTWMHPIKREYLLYGILLNDAKTTFCVSVCAPNSFFLLKLMMFILGNLYFVPESFHGKKGCCCVFSLIKNYKLTSSTIWNKNIFTKI